MASKKTINKREKKTKEKLAEDFLQMAELGQKQLVLTKTRENDQVYDQIKNALSGDDFTFHIDGKDYSGLEGHSASEINKIIAFLMGRLKTAGSQEEYEQIKKLIKLFYAQLEETQEQDQNNTQNKKESDKSDTENGSKTEQGLKDKDRSEYAEQKLTGTSQTTKPNVDTSKFDKMSQEELMACFKPNYFYSLSQEEQHALLQACTNRYLESQGVDPCAIILDDMRLDNNAIEYGCYRPNKGAIYLNRGLFANIAEMAGALNPFFPLKLLETVIHEARHRVQFMMFEQCPTTGAEREIQMSMTHSQSGLSYSEYLSEADELDARNAALAYMRQGAELTGSQEMQEFYCAAKAREMALPKADTTATMQEACSDIYDERVGAHFLNRTSPAAIKSSMNQMNDILHGYTFGYSAARTKKL